MKNKIVTYKHYLKKNARSLRNNSTLSEVLLWNELKKKKMLGFDFHRQKPIGKYIVDFYCPEIMLAIEIDGISHLFKEEEDKKRQSEIEDLGIEFLRFDDYEVKFNMDGVLRIIKNYIEERRGNKI